MKGELYSGDGVEKSESGNFTNLSAIIILLVKNDEFVRSPKTVTPVETGVQTSSRRKSETISKTGPRFSPGTLDSGFRRNDENRVNRIFYETIKIGNRKCE